MSLSNFLIKFLTKNIMAIPKINLLLPKQISIPQSHSFSFTSPLIESTKFSQKHRSSKNLIHLKATTSNDFYEKSRVNAIFQKSMQNSSVRKFSKNKNLSELVSDVFLEGKKPISSQKTILSHKRSTTSSSIHFYNQSRDLFYERSGNEIKMVRDLKGLRSIIEKRKKTWSLKDTPARCNSSFKAAYTTLENEHFKKCYDLENYEDGISKMNSCDGNRFGGLIRNFMKKTHFPKPKSILNNNRNEELNILKKKMEIRKKSVEDDMMGSKKNSENRKDRKSIFLNLHIDEKKADVDIQNLFNLFNKKTGSSNNFINIETLNRKKTTKEILLKTLSQKKMQYKKTFINIESSANIAKNESIQHLEDEQTKRIHNSNPQKGKNMTNIRNSLREALLFIASLKLDLNEVNLSLNVFL